MLIGTVNSDNDVSTSSINLVGFLPATVEFDARLYSRRRSALLTMDLRVALWRSVMGLFN